MTMAKDFASKAVVAFVAVAMLFSFFAPAAQAQSTEDMQTMINDLLAKIATLQSGMTSGSATASGYTWTRDLNVGASGADVKELQMFLNKDADTRVAATGAGSMGMETETYGPATAAAVSKFQVKYRADILAPAGLVNPTGYFGASTRAKANALNAAVVTEDEDEEEATEDEDEDMGELSGEADLTKVEIASADEDQIEEGAEDAPVAELTVEFEDGDASISRIDVTIASTSIDSWDVLETVSLWVDGDMVAEKDASDKDEYLDEDDGSLRFSGLDIVAMEDEELDIIVAVTLQNSIDSEDQSTFEVSVNAIRFFDADGVATTDDATGDMPAETVDFTIEAAGFEDELLVKTSTADLDADTLQVEDDSKSDFISVFMFDIDSDDSINDIELNEIAVGVTVSHPASYNSVVDDAELVIDGVTIDDFTVTGGATTSATLTFDVDGDVTIEAGDRVGAELKLRFKALATEGTTVQGTVAASAIEGEGADDVVSTGAATGDTHTLRTQGVAVELDSDSAVVTSGDNAGDDYATFKLVLDVTAFEQEVFISTDVATSVVAAVVNGAGATVSGTSTVIITSSADVEGGSFKIAEGDTETVTITVTFDALTANSAARLQLTSLKFDEDDDATPDQTWAALPANDYRTDIVTLVN